MTNSTPGDTTSVGAQPGKSGAQPGTVLGGRWQLKALLHQGELAQQYDAHDTMADRQCVITVINIDSIAEMQLDRLRECFRLAMRLQHPNLIAPTDIGETPDGKAFLVSPYTPGVRLPEAIRQNGALSPTRAAAICLQICGAYVHAHGKGVAHLLNESDIMLVKGERERDFVKITGFGVSLDDVKRMPFKVQAKTGTTPSVPFTPARRTLTADEIAADIQSFAMVMRNIVTDKGGTSGSASADDNKRAARRLKSIVDEVFSKEGRNCYLSFADLQRDLEMVQGTSESEWNSNSQVQKRCLKRKGRLTTIVAAAAIIILGTAGGAIYTFNQNQSANSFDYGESRKVLWPPGKASMPDVVATASTAKLPVPAPDAGYETVIKYADATAENGDFPAVMQALDKFVHDRSRKLSAQQKANVFGRLATADLQTQNTNAARAAADTAIDSIGSITADNAQAALEAGSVLAFVGISSDLNAREKSFLDHLQKNLPFELTNKFSTRVALLAARLGDLYREKHRIADAQHEYNIATQCWQISATHHSDLVKVMYGNALTCAAGGDKSDAIESFDRAIKEGSTDPGHDRLLSTIKSDYAKLLWETGNYGEALSIRWGIGN